MVSALEVYLVFVTKYRRGVLDEAMLRCCQAAMREVCADFGAELREFNGEAGRVNHAPVHGHFWSPFYLAASCGGPPLNTIRQYIDQQQRPA